MESSDWANLSRDLLDSILERLPSLRDYLRFGVVCWSWNSTLKHKKSKHAPLLLAYTGKEETWNFCDVANDEVLDLQLKLPASHFCGSSKGWLITMAENFLVSLINPFYNVKGKRPQENSIIKLPPLNPPHIAEDKDHKAHWAELFDHYILKGTISADPILDAKDCIVALIYFPYCQLDFIRPHSDKTWTYIDGVTNEHYMDSDIRAMYDIVYFKNKFYALDLKNGLFSFEANKFRSKDDVICVINRNQQLGQFGQSKRYLVESSDHGELLMIQRYYTQKGKRRSRATFEFKVFKLDDDKRNWIEINTLEDAAIFLGDNSSVYIATSVNFGCKANCIYFTHDQDKNVIRILPRDNGVYNMKTKIVSQIDTQAKALVKMSKKTPIWTNIKF